MNILTTTRTLVFVLGASPLAACATAAPAEPRAQADPVHALFYAKPADNWSGGALPIGNGRMGAMLFGGVAEERIQFNEQSLWSGDNNWDGAYNCGDHGFGAYRTFGDLLVSFGGAGADGEFQLTSPSGHGNGDGKAIANSVDGRADTKWCVPDPGQSVAWQVRLTAAQEVRSYALTSADDVPGRDPAAWVLEGSADGAKWVELDRRAPGKPFAERNQAQTFEVAHPQACLHYRLTFTPNAGASHFQIGEVALAGATLKAAPPAAPSDYRRTLDLQNGVHTTTFTQNGTRFKREAFASRPDQVMVFTYTADKKGALSGKVRLKSAQGAKTLARVGNQGYPVNGDLSFEGQMPNTLKYAALAVVRHQGGRVDTEGDAVTFKDCDSISVVLDARTDYAPDFKANWRGAAPMPRLEEELDIAAAKTHDALRAAHVRDLSALLSRAALDVGATDPAVLALPTDERLKRYGGVGGAMKPSKGDGVDASAGDALKREAAAKADPDLEETMFQYGRYLLASCSRPGGLPANLQGLWNDSNNPAWASDYHNNINIQMNYWGAESTNLAECHEPLMDYVVAQAEPCRIATRKAFGEKTRGWTARTSQNIFGGNGWDWNIPASAWYATHAFEHYAFTQDKAYLEKTAYPILKEACQMWEDRLKRLPDGSLVVPMGWSPEHGPREDGVMHDQQLIWELFQDYLEAAKALGVDANYQTKVADMQAHLAPNKIGKWGQLQEWQTDRDEPNDTHRHTSHLFAVYPGHQISVAATPELAKAAVVSLKARSNDHGDKTGKPFTVDTTIGDSRRSWTWPWRGALWARLGDGERAGIMVRGLLTYNTLPNLFCNHPPFQMDGNFGITGTYAEMLLQSHAGEIALLPAIPNAWAKQGSFTGLKARGDYTVDCAWADGKVTQYHIRAGKNAKRGTVKVRVNGEVKDVTPE